MNALPSLPETDRDLTLDPDLDHQPSHLFLTLLLCRTWSLIMTLDIISIRIITLTVTMCRINLASIRCRRRGDGTDSAVHGQADQRHGTRGGRGDGEVHLCA